MLKGVTFLIIIILFSEMFNFYSGASEFHNNYVNSLEGIKNFSVYYGGSVNQTAIDELNKFDLVILQHWAFTEKDLSEIKSIKIGYIDLGEFDNSTYPNCSVNISGIVIGYDNDWHQPIVNVSSPRWINYTICRVRYDLSMGFNGVLFDDLDVVEQYPNETMGMINIINIIHRDFPNAIIGVNRGFELIRNISSDINFVLYEDFGTWFNFSSNSYEFLNNSEIMGLENTTEMIKSLGIVVLGLGYSPTGCDYYTYFDNRLGDLLHVPVDMGNWNLSTIYLPCGQFNALADSLNSYYSWVIDMGRYILSAQLNDGAIKTSPSSNSIIPYVGNLASIGLVDAYYLTGNKSYLSGAMKWLEWYSEHQNRNKDNEGIEGTIYDYEIINGTETPTYDYGSSDSYASTYLTAVYDYYNATQNVTFLENNLGSIDLALKAIFSTMSNNLTYAKPDHKIKYLMNNCEVFNGLISASKIMVILKNTTAATELEKYAIGVKNAILLNFMINGSYFNWAIDTTLNFSDYYPDVMSNYWPIIDGVIEWNSTVAENVLSTLLNLTYYEFALNVSRMDLSSALYSLMMGRSTITQIILNSAESIFQDNSSTMNTEQSSWIIRSFFPLMVRNTTVLNYSALPFSSSFTLTVSFMAGRNGTILVFLPHGLNYSANIPSDGTERIGNDQYVIFNIHGNGTLDINISYNTSGNLYSVKFIEDGLPTGMRWKVTMGNETKISENTTIIFYLNNGSYTFITGSSGNYIPSPEMISVNVSGNDVIEQIKFHPERVFPIIFKESGIPNGTTWYVNLSNGENISSKNSTIIIYVKNETLYYSASSSLPGTSVISGNVSISGNNVTVPIKFIEKNSLPRAYIFIMPFLIIIIATIIFILRKEKFL